MATQATPRDIRKIAAQIKRKRTVRLAQIASKMYNQYRKGDRAGMANTMVDSFIELGGVYVKFLQGITLRSAALKNSTNTNKLKIFEDLDSEPLDIQAFLHSQLGRKVSEIVSVNPVPFAAGSFGQVYYAMHRDGTPVVLKVLRPLVTETLKYDLKLISMFSKRFMKKNAPNMDFDLNSAFKDFRSATLRETDYIAEAKFANKLYQHYKDHPKFVIPKTYVELSTTSLIVQEFINGISGAQLIRMHEQGVDPKDYIKQHLGSDLEDQLITVGYELIYSVFVMDHIQGDPHPGNIRFMQDNKVGMIDFGISAPSPKERAAFLAMLKEYEKIYSGQQDIANLFNQFLRFFVTDLYRALKKLNSMMPKKTNDEDFTKLVGKLAEQAFQSEMGDQATVTSMLKDANENQLMTLLNKIVNKDNRFGLILKLEASEVARASQTYLALVDSYGLRTTVLPKVFHQVIADVEKNMPDLVDDPDSETSISEALEIISAWLERIANRDPQLFKQLMARIRISDVPVGTKE